MARTNITAVIIDGVSDGGTNITNLTYETMSTGSGNGVTFTHDGNDLVVLNNPTGGDAVFTLVLAAPDSITDVGGSVTDPTITVAAGETVALRIPDIFKNTDDSDLVYIDCDVAGEIAVIDLGI